MKITELILGVVRDGRAETLRFDCAGADLVHVDVDRATASAAELARAVRETIAAPERTVLRDAVPFVRVTARAGEIQLEIADDAAAKMRVLTETRAGSMPLIIEAKHGDEESIDALLARVAMAADAADSELLLTAMDEAVILAGASSSDDEERAYAAARRRAVELQKAVRAIDDRMTLSVVPDWIWIATALGGIGVFMTVIALLYPELRVVVLPLFVGLSALGFAAYGLMSWRELKRRGALLAERRELRARREAARSEARAFAARGVKTTDALELPADVPLIRAGDAAPAGARQLISFIERGDTPASANR